MYLIPQTPLHQSLEVPWGITQSEQHPLELVGAHENSSGAAVAQLTSHHSCLGFSNLRGLISGSGSPPTISQPHPRFSWLNFPFRLHL